jgi:hypothetical protein
MPRCKGKTRKKRLSSAADIEGPRFVGLPRQKKTRPKQQTDKEKVMNGLACSERLMYPDWLSAMCGRSWSGGRAGERLEAYTSKVERQN